MGDSPGATLSQWLEMSMFTLSHQLCPYSDSDMAHRYGAHTQAFTLTLSCSHSLAESCSLGFSKIQDLHTIN